MERCLSINVLAVDVFFLIGEKRDGVVDVAMGDGVEHDFLAHLFDLTDHFN